MCLFLYDTLIIVLHNNLYLYITHGNILSMENKHKKLFVILALKKALICTYNASNAFGGRADPLGS